MENEIRVNDYVRTKDGNIAQITKIRKYTDRKLIETDCIGSFGYEYLKKQVVRYSPNLIDLIKPGDYVNGYEVGFIDGDEVHIDAGNEHYRFISKKEQEIQTIVTKEQIKAIEYRVKE